jgi:hypothetical protein
MRLLDVSVAALIGFSSIAVLVALNPTQLSEQGRVYLEQASLRDYLLSIVSARGVPWLHRASPDSICAAMLSFSNATLQVSAEGRNYICTTRPQTVVAIGILTLNFPDGDLTLLAWRVEGR